MQRLGLILHVTPSRTIIAKIQNIPRIGETVVDENLRSVGRISDILGPVSSPYATITPTIQDTRNLLNRTVYIVPSRRRKEKNRYGR